jgi:hypothetical protein
VPAEVAYFNNDPVGSMRTLAKSRAERTSRA